MIPLGTNRKNEILNKVHKDKKNPYELKHATVSKNGSMYYEIKKIKNVMKRINNR